MISGEASGNVCFCLACGEQVARVKDRRTINSLTSSHVTASWKTFFIEALKNNKQFSILEAAFPASEVLTANLKNQKHVCKKCFYIFEKFVKIEEVRLTSC